MPGAAATASATARVPAAKGSSSKAPIGPFQSTVPAAAIASRVGSGGARADVEAHPAVRHLDARRSRGARPRRRSASPSTRSTGSSSSQSEPSARSSASARELDPLLLDQRVAGRDPLGAEEAEAHRAADQDPVGDLEEALDHPDLVGDLGAAEDDDQRPRGGLDDPGQLGHLALEQQPGVAREAVGDTLGAGVGAVGGAEGVVDVEVGEGGSASPDRVVLRLPRLEADVLEQQHFARPQPARPASWTSPPITAGA